MIIAAVDQHKHNKLAWYFELESDGNMKNPLFKDRALLPGISAIHTVVITVMLKGIKRSILIGQTFIGLSDNNYWKAGGHFSFELMPSCVRILY